VLLDENLVEGMDFDCLTVSATDEPAQNLTRILSTFESTQSVFFVGRCSTTASSLRTSTSWTIRLFAV
jgi:hypothetical protein